MLVLVFDNYTVKSARLPLGSVLVQRTDGSGVTLFVLVLVSIFLYILVECINISIVIGSWWLYCHGSAHLY